MVDFSIRTLTAPFVPHVERYFDRTTLFIISKNPNLDHEQVDHDMKVLMFNATTALMASVISSVYFRRIALVTAAALIVLFYLVRRVINETFYPSKLSSETSTTMQQVLEMGPSLILQQEVQIQVIPQLKSLKEKFQEFFVQDDAIVIGSVVLLKTTYYPMPTIIGMLLTRRS